MKNTQSGFIGVALMILIAVVAIGGGAYVYTHKQSSEIFLDQEASVENSNKPENRVTDEKKDSSPVVPPPVIVTTKVAVNSKPETVSAFTGQNCGGILDKHLLAEVDKRTAQETKALECLSRAILDCSLTSLSVTGDGASMYQIFGKKGDNCVIGSTAAGKGQKCGVPIKLINSLQKYSIEKKESIENIIIPITFAMAFKGGEDISTGEKFTLACQEY